MISKSESDGDSDPAKSLPNPSCQQPKHTKLEPKQQKSQASDVHKVPQHEQPP
jgi:hypothetical protein